MKTGTGTMESGVVVHSLAVGVKTIIFSLFVFFSANGTVSSISGTAVAKDPTEPAKLLVSFFESKNS